MAYIHIPLVTHIISILGSIPLFSRLFNIHIYFSCHGIHFVYCIYPISPRTKSILLYKLTVVSNQ